MNRKPNCSHDSLHPDTVCQNEPLQFDRLINRKSFVASIPTQIQNKLEFINISEVDETVQRYMHHLLCAVRWSQSEVCQLSSVLCVSVFHPLTSRQKITLLVLSMDRGAATYNLCCRGYSKHHHSNLDHIPGEVNGNPLGLFSTSSFDLFLLLLSFSLSVSSCLFTLSVSLRLLFTSVSASLFFTCCLFFLSRSVFVWVALWCLFSTYLSSAYISQITCHVSLLGFVSADVCFCLFVTCHLVLFTVIFT